jgi:glycosyltransferase involved in cell wall biosynthesis
VPRRDERAARTVTPLKPYEALAMARPLVVADLPALTEIAAPDERGLAFPAGDAAALATALERLIDDPALGRRMGEAGRAWVARERSWAANGPRFRAVYDEVLARWDRTTSAGDR